MTDNSGAATTMGAVRRRSAVGRWRCGRANRRPWRRRPRWRGRYPKIKGMWWREGGVGQAPLASKTAVVRASSEDSGYVVVWGKGCTLTQSLMHRKPYT
jgi:hypothetical protein